MESNTLTVLLIFLPILVLFSVSFLMIALGKMFSIVLQTDEPNEDKNAPFECGFEEFNDSRANFDVRFYLVAILFLIFDLEIVFMVPWAFLVNNRDLSSWKIIFSMFIFLFVLLVGLLYEWKKGALEWE